jgi:polyhydroxybutyrate depolymerase
MERAQYLRKVFSLILFATFAAARGAGAEALESGNHSLGPGSHRVDTEYAGLGRSYIVHVPPQASSAHALPVILNFHGAGSNAEQEERYSGMDATADRDGFVAVYPNGTGRGTRALTWNAGGCCGYAERNKVDDVGFTKALLDDLASRVHIDRTRVYATGISNGVSARRRGFGPYRRDCARGGRADGRDLRARASDATNTLQQRR